MMSEADLNLCLGVLRGYYPGEWDDGRNIVWTDALDDLSRDEALAAIKEMGRTEDYPKVSRFLAIAKTHRLAERGRFSTGTGWIPLPGPVEPIDKSDPATAKRLLDTMRGMLKRVPEVDA